MLRIAHQRMRRIIGDGHLAGSLALVTELRDGEARYACSVPFMVILGTVAKRQYVGESGRGMATKARSSLSVRFDEADASMTGFSFR